MEYTDFQMSFVEAVTNEDYQDVLKMVGGHKGYDLDLLRLFEHEHFAWDTMRGEIWLILTKGHNVWTVKAELGDEYGRCSTYDHDADGLMRAVRGAIKDLCKDLDAILVNVPPFEVHGTMCLSNSGGIEIEINPSCDGVRYRYAYGQDEPDEPKEAEIVYQNNPDLDETENEENGPFACFVVDELEKEFEKDLGNDYLSMLCKELEYLQSREAIEDTLRANEYTFTKDGKRFG